MDKWMDPVRCCIIVLITEKCSQLVDKYMICIKGYHTLLSIKLRRCEMIMDHDHTKHTQLAMSGNEADEF